MHQLMLVGSDDRLEARRVLADVSRAIRTIVEFLLGWNHDASVIPCGRQDIALAHGRLH
jgi:hypothetical protein